MVLITVLFSCRTVVMSRYAGIVIDFYKSDGYNKSVMNYIIKTPVALESGKKE